MSRHGHVGRDGDAVHSVTLEVGIDLDPLLLLGGEERLEVVEDVVVSPLKPVERLLFLGMFFVGENLLNWKRSEKTK